MIKAIETVYGKYRYRSRLEARWAVFFDVLGISYEYEKEGFDLGNGVWYLPDFWLPAYEAWWEVKGTNPSKAEREKLVLLAEGTNNPAFLAWGEVSQAKPASAPGDDGCENHNVELILPLTWDSMIEIPESHGLTYGLFSWWVNWERCNQCGHIMPMAPVLHTCHGIIVGKCDCHHANNLYTNPYDSIIVAAYQAARQARFEHGENGIH